MKESSLRIMNAVLEYEEFLELLHKTYGKRPIKNLTLENVTVNNIPLDVLIISLPPKKPFFDTSAIANPVGGWFFSKRIDRNVIINNCSFNSVDGGLDE